MKIRLNMTHFGLIIALAIVLSLSSDAVAQHVNREYGYNPDKIVIRRTIPDPQAVKRTPLTSDRLSTTSTRLIDARRGFRSYSSVYGCGASHLRYAAYDDHFGISRPENRPYSYSQRTPRTYVSQFRNDASPSVRAAAVPAAEPAYSLLLRDDREQASDTTPKPDMKIRIHNDRSAIPTTSGAVLITADGTVIQVGD